MNLINSKNKRLYLKYFGDFGGWASLEDDINNWLSKNTDIEIVQIIHTSVGTSSSNAYIYYYKMNNNLI